MPTAADFEPELVEALNLLIEDERASVEMEVALASGATEYTERDTLARMGADDIHSCETLRAEMESAGLEVTPQINGVVFEVLGAERYDDRLRSFAHHQRVVADRATYLLESNLDGELRAALESIIESHQRHIEWASMRADAFAATRLLEFGSRPVTPPQPTPAAEMVTPEPAAPEETPAIDAALPVIESAIEVESEPEITFEPASAEPAPEAAPIEVTEAPEVVETSATPETPETPETPATAPRKRATRAATPRASKSAPKTAAASSTPRPRATRARKPTPPASAD